MAAAGSWTSTTAGAPPPPDAASGAAARDRWAATGNDLWGAWTPRRLELDLAVTGSGPGQEQVLCSEHGRHRTRGNMMPDGANGLTCRPEHPCLGGRVGQSRGGCPRDAETGKRIDATAAGDLLAAPPEMTDAAILNDLAEAAACRHRPGPLNDRTRAFLLARLADSGVDAWAAPGWWYSAPTHTQGRTRSLF